MADGVARGGFPLRVFDLSGDCMAERVAVGAVAGESSVEAASGADILCVVVHDDGQVLDLVDRAVLEVMAPDGIVVLHSTVTLATVRTVHERCRAHTRHLVDVGISGGAGGAADGTLVMIAGGEDAVLDRVVPILDCYSRKLVRLRACRGGHGRQGRQESHGLERDGIGGRGHCLGRGSRR